MKRAVRGGRKMKERRRRRRITGRDKKVIMKQSSTLHLRPCLWSLPLESESKSVPLKEEEEALSVGRFHGLLYCFLQLGCSADVDFIIYLFEIYNMEKLLATTCSHSHPY